MKKSFAFTRNISEYSSLFAGDVVSRWYLSTLTGSVTVMGEW